MPKTVLAEGEATPTIYKTRGIGGPPPAGYNRSDQKSIITLVVIGGGRGGKGQYEENLGAKGEDVERALKHRTLS